jgi:hypothetical protein
MKSWFSGLLRRNIWWLVHQSTKKKTGLLFLCLELHWKCFNKICARRNRLDVCSLYAFTWTQKGMKKVTFSKHTYVTLESQSTLIKCHVFITYLSWIKANWPHSVLLLYRMWQVSRLENKVVHPEAVGRCDVWNSMGRDVCVPGMGRHNLEHTHFLNAWFTTFHTSSGFTRVYPKVSGLAVWSENCKWYSSLPLDAVVSLFCESV